MSILIGTNSNLDRGVLHLGKGISNESTLNTESVLDNTILNSSFDKSVGMTKVYEETITSSTTIDPSLYGIPYSSNKKAVMLNTVPASLFYLKQSTETSFFYITMLYCPATGKQQMLNRYPIVSFDIGMNINVFGSYMYTSNRSGVGIGSFRMNESTGYGANSYIIYDTVLSSNEYNNRVGSKVIIYKLDISFFSGAFIFDFSGSATNVSMSNSDIVINGNSLFKEDYLTAFFASSVGTSSKNTILANTYDIFNISNSLASSNTLHENGLLSNSSRFPFDDNDVNSLLTRVEVTANRVIRTNGSIYVSPGQYTGVSTYTPHYNELLITTGVNGSTIYLGTSYVVIFIYAIFNSTNSVATAPSSLRVFSSSSAIGKGTVLLSSLRFINPSGVAEAFLNFTADGTSVTLSETPTQYNSRLMTIIYRNPT